MHALRQVFTIYEIVFITFIRMNINIASEINKNKESDPDN